MKMAFPFCLLGLTVFTAQTADTTVSLIWYEWIIWYAVALFGILGSALFSGLETGIYTLNRVKLHVLAETPGNPSAKIMQKMMDNPGKLIGTLLISNNLMNYIATFAIAVLLEAYGLVEWRQLLVNTLILTPLLLVFGEVLPKDTFGNYSDKLTYPFARLLNLTQWLFTLTLLLPIVDGASRVIGKCLGNQQLSDRFIKPRTRMMRLVREGVGQGVISQQQSRIVQRVLNPTERIVADAMIPWMKVAKIHESTTLKEFYLIADEAPYSRYPVMNEKREVTGIVTVYAGLTQDPDHPKPMSQIMSDVMTFPPNTAIRVALRELQSAKKRCGVVVRNGRPIGFFTLKDLVEPYLGDLRDW